MIVQQEKRPALLMTSRSNRSLCARRGAILTSAILVAVAAHVSSFAPAASAQTIFTENFDSLALGPAVSTTETGGDGTDWTSTPPPGWTVDNSNHTNGTLEFNGWTFLDPVFWNATAGQDRNQFTRGQNVIAVADPDEWDDDGSPSSSGQFNSFLTTPSISLAGQQAGSLNLHFDSSWRPFADQTGTVTVRYDAGNEIELLRLDDSVPDALNGEILVPLNNPVGATSAVISFGLTMAGNDWWWAIDNVEVLVGDPVLSLLINRDTGAMTIGNGTTGNVNISSYQIDSAVEALDPNNWLSIAENYDAGNPGPNQVDAAHDWSELTDPTAHGDFSEADLDAGTGTSLGPARTINLANAGAWIQNPTEDLAFQYISDSQIVTGIVSYIGNGGLPFTAGDLNVDGDIDMADWVIFRTNQHADLGEFSLAEAYRRGDLTGDRLNNHADFVQFKTAFDAANGAGAFDAMLASIPEPTSMLLGIGAGLFVLPTLRRVRPTTNTNEN
ncbi:MAG TPA: hypothetical protein VJ828_16780 [Lacipirellulaceae bacterium]|nr:hypothetical protein [Lacipirellulaceae bacterium]